MYSIATTALSDFWETNKTIIFISSACKRFSQKTSWENLSAIDLPCEWQDKANFKKAYESSYALFNEYLPICAELLNKVHKKKHSTQYWKIVIGPWLLQFISSIYDKYHHIKKIQEQYTPLSTIGLDKTSFILPKDFEEEAALTATDEYNLQIYSLICSFLAIPMTTRTIDHKAYTTISDKNSAPAKRSIGTQLRSFMFRTARTPILMYASYFSKQLEKALLLRSRGKIIELQRSTWKTPLLTINRDLRSQLSLPESELMSEFKRLIFTLLPECIPLIYIEGYTPLTEFIPHEFPSPPKTIFSSIGWYADPFKIWAATCAEQGTILLGTQHGGDYGSLTFNSLCDYEIDLVDRFYSWGWTHQKYKNKVTPMPTNKLAGVKQESPTSEQPEILYVTTASLRFLYRFDNLTYADMPEYIEWQSRFLNALSGSGIPLRIRLYHDDHGWDIKEQIQMNAPGYPIESWSIPFAQSLHNCRLYVCDHLSTTFLESLYRNKPTVIFWDKQKNTLLPEARIFYDALHDAQILFYTPEEASCTIKKIYSDIPAWWNAPGRQAAIRMFCNNFARSSNNSDAKDWTKELMRYA